MTADTMRALALNCIDAHAKRELNNAYGYDWKVGLMACGRARIKLEGLPIASSASDERRQIIGALQSLMTADGLEAGEYSNEAASIGSILHDFEARSAPRSEQHLP